MFCQHDVVLCSEELLLLQQPARSQTWVAKSHARHLRQLLGIAGRVNHMDKWILPNGEWPVWCSWCRGSGLMYCDHCLGTGKHREKMGFQLPHTETQ